MIVRVDSPRYVPARSAARTLGVHLGTLRKWVRCKLLKAYRTPTGRLMVRVGDLSRVYKESRPR